MKKILFLGVFLLCINTLNAQLYINGDAHYELRLSGYVGFSGDDCGTNFKGGLQWIVGLYEKGGYHPFAQGNSSYPNTGHGLKNSSFGNSNPIKFKEDNKIYQIKIWTSWREEELLGADCSNTDNTSVSVDITEYYINKHYKFKHKISLFPLRIIEKNLGLNQPGHFDLNIKPVIELTPKNSLQNTLGDKDQLIIPDIEGVNPKYYTWQYKVIGGEWKELGQKFQNKSGLNINASDFLSESDINKNVDLRVVYKTLSSLSPNPIYENISNIINFTLRKSLPKLISHTLSKTTCYNTTDGKIVLQFDRPLATGEAITFNILNSKGQPIQGKLYDISKLEENNTFTINNLAADNYTLNISGKYDNQPSYSPYNTATPFRFTISKNPPVDFSFSKTDVFCHNGKDGEIRLTASGGTGSGYEYELNNNGVWTSFDNNNQHIIKNLTAGTYVVNVRDSNQCVAKVQQNNGTEIELKENKNTSITIAQPSESLKISYPSHSEPTFFGTTNGKIVAKITGGTPLADNSYQFEWKNTQNQVVGTTQTTFSAGAFYITLDHIPADTYFLTIRDKNHASATDKTGCTIINSEFILKQPTPLKAEIQLIRPISCHSENEFGNEKDQNSDGQRDESQDGILKIIASGGVPFTLGNPYKYVWKKQKADGSWAVLPFEEDTARGLSDGNYAINIEDANGIILGQYNLTTNSLQKATDVVYRFSQPEKLTLSFEKTDASCRGNDGSLLVTAQGGTPPYRYQWSNGETSPSIQNLLPLPYFVIITDSRGCKVEGNITINQPNALKITENITPLLCHNATDASIEVSVEGGTLPYTYQWSNGANTSRVNNLSSGSYELKITDGQGCSYFKHFTIENPSKFEINIGEDRTLCNEQTYEIDTKINDPQAQYQWYWNNQLLSNNSKIIISRSGTYKAIVRTKNGCEATDEISITTTTAAISAEFLLTTQAYENQEVILVNTSTPKGESTQWIVPNHSLVEVTNQDDDYISLIFKEKGEYQIGIKQTQGECFEVFYKTILVEENNGFFNEKSVNQAFVKEFSVAPNPNNGHFKAKVILEKATPLNFRLYNIAGELMLSQKAVSNTEHWVDFQTQLAAGTYILVLETPYQQISKKIIIH